MRDVWGHGVRCKCRSCGRGLETPAASLPFRGPASRLLLIRGPHEGLVDREVSRATTIREDSGNCGGFNVRLEGTIKQREDVESARLRRDSSC
jgi:hypothetical protein